MKDTTGRGDITEIEVAAALMRTGRRVLRPLSNGLRYDLLIDNANGTFTRVQCKTGILRDGRIAFRVYRTSGHRARAIPYHGQADAFGVHCPQTREAYLVPMVAIANCNNMVCLRVSPTRNGQTRGIRSAKEFRISS